MIRNDKSEADISMLNDKALQGDRTALQALYQRHGSEYETCSDTGLRYRYAEQLDALAGFILHKKHPDAGVFYRGFSLKQQLLLFWNGDKTAANYLYATLQKTYYAYIRKQLLGRNRDPYEHADDVFHKFCLDSLITHRNKLQDAFKDKDNDYVEGYFFRRVKWMIQDYFSAPSADRQDDADLENYPAIDEDPADLSSRLELIAIVFSLIAGEPCDRRSLYIAYHYGSKLDDLAILCNENNNSVRNKVITNTGKKIEQLLDEIIRKNRQPPACVSIDQTRVWQYENQAEDERLLVQAFFQQVDQLLNELKPDSRHLLASLLEKNPADQTEKLDKLMALLSVRINKASPIEYRPLNDSLSFIRKLRQLPCCAREALLCWDYLHQPLSDVIRCTVAADTLAASAGQSAVDTVFAHWRQGADGVLEHAIGVTDPVSGGSD